MPRLSLCIKKAAPPGEMASLRSARPERLIRACGPHPFGAPPASKPAAPVCRTVALRATWFELSQEAEIKKRGRKGPVLFIGAPGEIRTPDRPVRSRVLYPAELRAHFFNYKFSGGERGIRTLEGLLTLTPLAGERFRPLSHLSIGSYPLPYGAPRERHSTDRCTQGKAPRRYSPGLLSSASSEAFSL